MMLSTMAIDLMCINQFYIVDNLELDDDDGNIRRDEMSWSA